jgi:toxin-antitoxin system PIN domain toxin
MPDSNRYADWLAQLLDSGDRFAVSELVFSGFLRIVTNPKIFKRPSTLENAAAFIDVIVANPNCVRVSPGETHWDIVVNLCKAAGARGNLISDAYLAAIAIESDCEWVTNDRDYAIFPGLKWKHPLRS